MPRALLQERRRQFPRFYFVSDDDLLVLLSLSAQSAKAFELIHKLLPDTERVLFDRESSVGDVRPNAVGFVSIGGEHVMFDQVNGLADLFLFKLTIY